MQGCYNIVVLFYRYMYPERKVAYKYIECEVGG